MEGIFCSVHQLQRPITIKISFTFLLQSIFPLLSPITQLSFYKLCETWTIRIPAISALITSKWGGGGGTKKNCKLVSSGYKPRANTLTKEFSFIHKIKNSIFADAMIMFSMNGKATCYTRNGFKSFNITSAAYTSSSFILCYSCGICKSITCSATTIMPASYEHRRKAIAFLQPPLTSSESVGLKPLRIYQLLTE